VLSLGEDDYEQMQWKDLPNNWPTHFNYAICLLNRHLLPSLKCSPAELMLGLVINTNRTPIVDAALATTAAQIGIHQAYTQQQCLNGYTHTMEHAAHQKAIFDRQLLAKFPWEVLFKAGQLVQVYCNDLTYTFETECKLLPCWSPPRRVVSCDQNS
jgi:hypothetical protein